MIAKCIKCGHEDIFVQFVKDGALIDSSSSTKESDEFVKSSEYSVYYKLSSKKDHLSCKCRKCGYFTRCNTLDAQS